MTDYDRTNPRPGEPRNPQGMRDTRLEGSPIGTEPVTYLTAFPANPVTREENSDAESYVAAGVAWDVLGDPVRILAKDVIPQQGDPAGAVPSEPFFLN